MPKESRGDDLRLIVLGNLTRDFSNFFLLSLYLPTGKCIHLLPIDIL